MELSGASTCDTQIIDVPAGPAVVAFSVGLSPANPSEPTFCSLVDVVNPATIFVSAVRLTFPTIAGQPDYGTIAITRVIDLATPTRPRLSCFVDFRVSIWNYQWLSIDAISFATPQRTTTEPGSRRNRRVVVAGHLRRFSSGATH
jgi:hypothetical protein